MITKIEIDGFKTFSDFSMEFAPFTVIAGYNASGKSNLFDALQLLSSLASTDLKTAFLSQRGEPNELFTQYSEEAYAQRMRFAVELLISPYIRDNWGKEEVILHTRLRYELIIERYKNEDTDVDSLRVTHESLEKISPNDDVWLKRHIKAKHRNSWRPPIPPGKHGRTSPYIGTEPDTQSIVLHQEGSGGKKKPFSIGQNIGQTVVSGINSADFPTVFAVREEMRSWKFLQFDPTALREPTRQDVGMSDIITAQGGNLAAALYRISRKDEDSLRDISRQLGRLLPDFTDVEVHDDKAHRQFIIKVRNEDGREFSSRVLSEGTLRVLALCVLSHDDRHQSLLCFEEPENGIHPGRIKGLVELLQQLHVDFEDPNSPLRQIIINTHSPKVVAAVFELEIDTSAGVWLTQTVTRCIKTDTADYKTHITTIKPVISGLDSNKAGVMNFDPEMRLTVHELQKYLDTNDLENVKQRLRLS